MICDQRFLLGSSLWKTFWYLSWPLSLALVSTTLWQGPGQTPGDKGKGKGKPVGREAFDKVEYALICHFEYFGWVQYIRIARSPLSYGLCWFQVIFFDRYFEFHLMIYLWLWCPCWYSQPSSIYMHGFTLYIYVYRSFDPRKLWLSASELTSRRKKDFCPRGWNNLGFAFVAMNPGTQKKHKFRKL